MSGYKKIGYIILIFLVLFILISPIYYYINLSNNNIFKKDSFFTNKIEWNLEDEIKKFTKLEDLYIKDKI